MDRRKFIFYGVGGAGALGVGLLSGSFVGDYLHFGKSILRPPGALNEREFLATCIKCGQCVQVCPYYSLSLLDITSGSSLGTPHINPRERGCYLCDLYPCVLACPSGALSHDTTEISDVHMGMAHVKRADSCLALNQATITSQSVERVISRKTHNDREESVVNKIRESIGKPCSLCADLCPHPEPLRAIAMVESKNGGYIPEIRDACVGCGVCEEVCPASDAVIVMIPRATYSEIYGG